MPDVLNLLQNLLAISSVLAAVASALAAFIFRYFLELGVFFGRRPTPSEAAAGTGRREEARIVEAVTELVRQERANRWNRWIAGGLTAGQYLVGAALASSFIQSNVSEYYVGVLGLIVLFSQVIQQRFRPDLRAIGSRERIIILQRLIRDAEDQLYAAETKRDGAPTLYDIRLIVSRGLSEVERHESEELAVRIRGQLEPADSRRGAPNNRLERSG